MEFFEIHGLFVTISFCSSTSFSTITLTHIFIVKAIPILLHYIITQSCVVSVSCAQRANPKIVESTHISSYLFKFFISCI